MGMHQDDPEPVEGLVLRENVAQFGKQWIVRRRSACTSEMCGKPSYAFIDSTFDA